MIVVSATLKIPINRKKTKQNNKKQKKNKNKNKYKNILNYLYFHNVKQKREMISKNIQLAKVFVKTFVFVAYSNVFTPNILYISIL